MFKKILSVLLIGLLVMSSMGCVSATAYYYHYNCHVGDKVVTDRVMEDIGDPTYTYMWGLNNALHKCQYLKFIGHSLRKNVDQFEPIRPGSGRYKVESLVGDDDYLTIDVIRK